MAGLPRHAVGNNFVPATSAMPAKDVVSENSTEPITAELLSFHPTAPLSAPKAV
ncbi:hypothetical protein ACQ5SK_02255 [Bradyrhizobium japonicum]